MPGSTPLKRLPGSAPSSQGKSSWCSRGKWGRSHRAAVKGFNMRGSHGLDWGGFPMFSLQVCFFGRFVFVGGFEGVWNMCFPFRFAFWVVLNMCFPLRFVFVGGFEGVWNMCFSFRFAFVRLWCSKDALPLCGWPSEWVMFLNPFHGTLLLWHFVAVFHDENALRQSCFKFPFFALIFYGGVLMTTFWPYETLSSSFIPQPDVGVPPKAGCVMTLVPA